MDDGLAPLDVAQEVVAQAAAFAGSLDQAGHIGDGEGGFSGHHHAQIGDQRGERIVGDLRLCRRNRRDQTGFAGARVADQADVGQHLELEVDDAFVAFLAEEGEAGRLAGRRGERGVAQPALAAACHHDLVDLPEIGEHTAGSFVGDDGALGHHQDDVFAVGAVAVPTHAGLPVLGLAHRLPVVVDQRCQTEPWPPLPALTVSRARSTNDGIAMKCLLNVRTSAAMAWLRPTDALVHSTETANGAPQCDSPAP